MKILIMGTSNSLIKGGWVDGFKENLPCSEVTNISIGASPGIQFTAQLDRDFSEYDYVIFDSVPNDEEHMHHGNDYNTRDFNYQITHDICAIISSQTNLIVLGISTQSCFYKESFTYDDRRRISQSCGAQFIDIRQLVKLNAQFLMLQTHASSLYDAHPSHPFPPIMRIIGSALAKTITDVAKPLYPVGVKQVEIFNHYYTVGANSLSSGKLVTLKNRLLTETFRALNTDDCLFFQQSDRCLGFYVNHAASNATVSISHLDEELLINLANNRTSDRLLKVFVALPGGPRLAKAYIAAPPKTDSKNYNPLVFSNYSKTNSPTSLQVSTFVFYETNNENISIEYFHAENHFQNDISKQIQLQALSRNPLAEPVKIGTIKNAFNQYLFFNLRSNRCISIDSQLVSFRASDIFPITLYQDGDDWKLQTIINGNSFFLSIYDRCVCLDPALPLPLNAPHGKRLGENIVITKTAHARFAISCKGAYVFSAPNRDISCDRSAIQRCEQFMLETTVGC